jgi:hypothetical protein
LIGCAFGAVVDYRPTALRRQAAMRAASNPTPAGAQLRLSL